jgi:hypothetical protein
MPYAIRKKDGKYCVVTPSGRILGEHETRAGAERQRRAVYANAGTRHGGGRALLEAKNRH